MIFFTADTHYCHSNIIKYCKRPFSSVSEMDAIIIKKHNEVVSPGDDVYFLGDFAFDNQGYRAQAIFDRLNGNKFLIKGNHDKIATSIKGWGWIKPYYELKHKDTDFILMHYALRVWNKSHHGSYHLYGHSHGELPILDNRSMDVGVDTNNFYPYSIDQIIEKLKDKKYGVGHER